DAVIPAGNPVLIHLGGANRDPRAFEAPNALEIRRDPNPHLAFGRARHSCLGGPLVELQMRIALECLLDRVDRMELAVDEVAYVPRPGHRWVEAVPVRWME
ncbi:MAG: cytochrome P450, partial [Gemmatimonadota bacterium]